jgi:hypothetical protein
MIGTISSRRSGVGIRESLCIFPRLVSPGGISCAGDLASFNASMQSHVRAYGWRPMPRPVPRALSLARPLLGALPRPSSRADALAC